MRPESGASSPLHGPPLDLEQAVEAGHLVRGLHLLLGAARAEMAKLGYRLAASSGTAFAAMVKAVRLSYECLAQDKMDPFLGPGGAEKEMKAAHQVTGLDRLIEIERRTMKGA